MTKLIFLYTVLLFATKAFATIYNTNLVVSDTSDNSDVNGLYVTAAFEGTTLYFFLGEQKDAIPVTYDSNKSRCWVTTNGQNYYMYSNSKGFIVGSNDPSLGQFVSFATGSSPPNNNVYIDNYYFYSRKDVGDPDNLSKSQYPLLSAKSFDADASTRSFNLLINYVSYDGAISLSQSTTASPIQKSASASATWRTVSSVGSRVTTSSTPTTTSTTTPAPTSSTSNSSKEFNRYSKLIYIAFIAVPILIGLAYVVYLYVFMNRRKQNNSVYVYPNQNNDNNGAGAYFPNPNPIQPVPNTVIKQGY